MKRLTFLIIVCLTSTLAFAQYDNDVFTVVEIMPRFLSDSCEQLGNERDRRQCANQALLNYIYDNIELSESAKQREVIGLNVASFVIEKDSTISNIRIIRSFDSAADSAVLKVLKEMPKWRPGQQRNRPERVKFNLPIRFRHYPQWLIDSFEYSIFTIVDDKPTFDTCDNAVDKFGECTKASIENFIIQNMEYPETALKNKVEGRCVVKFVVEKDSTLSNFRIVQGTDTELDDEALRMMKLLPNFQPAICRGVPVRNEMRVVIDFNLVRWKYIKKQRKKYLKDKSKN